MGSIGLLAVRDSSEEVNAAPRSQEARHPDGEKKPHPLADEAFVLLLKAQLPAKPVLVVVFEAEVGDEVGSHDVAEGVLELHGLDEEVMFGVQSLASLR
jgi:hypothetical protein